MIITRLIGGLGNQMFQYAAAYALSIRRGVPLKLDVRGFQKYSRHQGFELDRVFSISAEVASEQDSADVLGWRRHPRVLRILRRKQMTWLCAGRYAREPYFEYWEGVERLPGRCYMEGNWQSEKYFADRADAIRREFRFKQPLSPDNQVIAAKMKDRDSVSVHVRRGDYVSDPRAFCVHGLCSLEYYRAAVERITAAVEAPEFFIFSDDPEWVRANLALPHPCRYVAHNTGAESYNDMRLMSLCRHHIIANSSFSWWGAWLGHQGDGIVIAPERWFAVNRSTADLIPASWIRV